MALSKLQSTLYQKAVKRTLNFYEKYVLPPDQNRVSLSALKQREFTDRKKLLNPYQKQLLLQESKNTDQLTKLSKKVSINTMKTFTVTYDRHEGRYGFRDCNFPEQYPHGTSFLEYAHDPDWSVKMQTQRLNLQLYMLITLGICGLIYKRLKSVEKFDKLKRQEQRAMQNKEVDQVFNKKVKYTMFLQKPKDEQFEYLQFTENSVKSYVILWYDAKMNNYIHLNEFLAKRKLAQARIQTYLVVDKIEHAEKSSEIFTKLKKQHKILLKRELSDQEQLLLSFSKEEDDSQEESIDLDLKKNFFYVINPQQRIIDCASIYSFLHEDNIHQRVVAKILKDVDETNERG